MLGDPSSDLMANKHRLQSLKWVSNLALLTAAVAASATTLYVSPTGNDGNNGTSLSTPVKTLAQATYLSSHGDLILVRDGGGTPYIVQDTIGPNYAQNLRGKGTSSDWVHIKAYPGEHPVFDFSGYTNGDPLFVTANSGSSAYLSIEGLTFTGSNAIGLSLFNVNDVVVKNVKVSGATNAGIYVGTTGTALHGIEIVNCEVTNCARVNSSLTSPTWPPALFVDKVDGIRIQGCNVHENFGEGIGMRRTTNSSAFGNTVWNNFSVNMYLDTCSHIDLYQNTVYTTPDTAYFRTTSSVPTRAKGIVVAQEKFDLNDPGLLTSIHIYNNNILDCRTAIYFADFGWGNGVTDCSATNNYGFGNDYGLVLDTNKQYVTDSGNNWR